MSEFNFKGEDRVYYPLQGNSIFKLANIETKSGRTLKIFDLNNKFFYTNNPTTFYPNGFHHLGVGNPSIFPATQEWYERLSHVYPNLEKPPVKKSSREIIQAIINSNHKFIACINKSVDVEKHPLDGMGIFSAHTLKTINYEKLIGELVPFDLETGKVIVDFVDGKPVLESGNE